MRCQCGAPMMLDDRELTKSVYDRVVRLALPRRCSETKALRDECAAPTKVRVMPARKTFQDLPWMVNHQIRYRPDDSILGVVGQPMLGHWNWLTTADPATGLPRMGWADSRDQAIDAMLLEHPE